jgi:hypothetical protein
MVRLSYRTTLQNIRKVYRLATPQEVEAGLHWYDNAHAHACELSSLYGIPLRASAEIIAALSPNSRWERNVADAYSLCAVLSSGGPLESVRVQTYGKNRAKAGAIFRAAVAGLRYDGILAGPKVTRFAVTIERPWESHGITVDVHAFSVASGKRFTTKDVVIGAVNYRTCERAYLTVGAELGIAGHQVQAVTWIVWKRLHNI